MKERSFLYVVGPTPYDSCHNETKGNGDWYAKAANAEEALQVIFNSMDFPAEATGRKSFVPGVSLPNTHADDVIQVWSTEPEVADATRKALGKKMDEGGYHNGNGRDFGLDREVKVTDLDKYFRPAQALLASPTTSDAEPSGGISPMAASVAKYQEMKHEIKKAVQVQKMDVVRRQWEVEQMSERMGEKMREMQAQIAVFDAYLHGTRHRHQISRGNRGTGKYRVYQNRVFLSEEVSILGNFVDMDFKGMEDMEKWLVDSGHIWKLLPFERCVLATRIRREKKDYGDPMTNFYNNLANMQNMIWIRDGENVFHVDVEYDFHNAIFPGKDQFDKAKREVQDSLFSKSFRWSEPRNWHGQKLKKGDYDVMGQMRRKPLEEKEPYYTMRTVKQRFHTMEEWLDSECYTPELDVQISVAIHDWLRERNKKQMIFAVIMQGIVDNTNYLEIPKGTDMFNWESVDKYLELVFDYNHGLPFKGWAEKVEPFINGKVEVGDWIVTKVNEYISRSGYRDGISYKESKFQLFKVVGLEEVTKRKMGEFASKDGSSDWVDYKVKCPVVKYYPKAKRWNRNLDYAEFHKARAKTPINLVIDSSPIVRVPMSPKYAEDILNDREWKKANPHLVPVMVNYGSIIKAMKAPVNATFLEWKVGSDD